jgi:hypothetical protein
MSRETKIDKTALLGAFSFINGILVQLINILNLGDYKAITLSCSSPLALYLTYRFYVYVKVERADSVADMKLEKEYCKAIKKFEELSQSKKCTDAEKAYYLGKKNQCIKLQTEHTFKKLEKFKLESDESKTTAVMDVISAVASKSPKK